jgi:uncharacterized repeat protein (TIGR01451 family)
VTVNDPLTGDGLLANALTGTDSSNCAAGSSDARCSTTTPIRALEIVKTTDTAAAAPGNVVRYTLRVTDVGTVDYAAPDLATFTDDLSAVLDDATYNGDGTADTGTADFSALPTMTWSGELLAGETATITYSVTVNDPTSGDGQLTNVAVGPPESNCDAALAGGTAAAVETASGCATETVVVVPAEPPTPQGPPPATIAPDAPLFSTSSSTLPRTGTGLGALLLVVGILAIATGALLDARGRVRRRAG